MIREFLRRPVMAMVLSIVIVLLGGLAMRSRPVSQFPEIAPPRVMVSLAFPGASADVLVKSSIITLERAINGVPGMSYMISDATSAGEAVIQVVFELGTDEDQAVVNVKTRVDQVLNRLPPLVQLEGVVINRVQPSMLMYVNLYSSEKSADQKFLYNFANANLLPELSRIDGIAQTRILGSRQYAMRIWLNPERMLAYKISTDDVMRAVSEQSVIGRPGRLGQATGKQAQALEYVLVYEGRFNKPEQYENIILRANEDGEMLRLKDVATVELGSEFFDIYSNLDGYPSAAIVLKQTYGSNARDVIANVKAKLEELKKTSFPAGMDYAITYDVSSFLDASIEQVLHTLVEAFLLVALVVFVFLGDWRSTLIPTLAVPVSLVGTFAVMHVFGITINLITLFALVLAIGVVVDDAIVVVEAVHVKMEKERLSPYAAAKRTVGEIAGAIVAITLMMTSVFVPVAFMTGPVGVFFRQFAITMAASIVLSGVVALTLTPVLCAMILRSEHGTPRRKTPVGLLLDVFNRVFDRGTGFYVRVLRRVVDRRLVTFAVLALFGLGIFAVNRALPAGFVPNEDQGMIYAIVQTPPGTTLEQTNEVSRQLQSIAKQVDGVESVSSLAGYEVLTEGRGSNAGTCLINLKDWSHRRRSVAQVVAELEEKSKDIGAVVEFFEPPAVPGYGAASGFALRLLDKNNETDYQEFDRVQKEFVENLKKRKELTGLFTFFAANYPQYELVVDNELAMQKGVSIKAAMENLDILIGSTYEQGFVRFGRFYKVYTQSAARLPADAFGPARSVREERPWRDGPVLGLHVACKRHARTERDHALQPLQLLGDPRRARPPGTPAETRFARCARSRKRTLPRGYDIAWEGLSFDEARRGNEAISHLSRSSSSSSTSCSPRSTRASFSRSSSCSRCRRASSARSSCSTRWAWRTTSTRRSAS
jgi:HAE1 family hydrophobic/amphiphilic exporter-1